MRILGVIKKTLQVGTTFTVKSFYPTTRTPLQYRIQDYRSQEPEFEGIHSLRLL